jgi:hypothetical protein
MQNGKDDLVLISRFAFLHFGFCLISIFVADSQGFGCSDSVVSQAVIDCTDRASVIIPPPLTGQFQAFIG